MLRFRPVTVFLYSGKQVYSFTGEDPVDLPVSGYSVLKVQPNYDGTRLGEVSTTYVYGSGEGDYISSVYGDSALEFLVDDIQADGCALIDRVIDFNRSFSPDDARQILEIFPVLGHETEQRLVDAFAVGVGGTVGYLGIMGSSELWTEDRMPFPFYFALPDNDQNGNRPCSASVQRSTFDYLDVIGQVVLAINDGSLGQRWLESILNFWSIWQDALPVSEPDPKLQQRATQAASKGLAGYIGEMTTSLADRYRHLNDELDHATERLRCQRDEAIVAYRFHKQTHLGDLQTTKNTILDEVDRKLEEFRCSVNAATKTLKETNTTVITDELECHRSKVLDEVDDAKHIVVEEIVRVKDECLRTMDTSREKISATIEGLVSTHVRQALNNDSLIQGYIKELLRPVIEETIRKLQPSTCQPDKYVNKGERQDNERFTRIEESLRRMEGAVHRVETGHRSIPDSLIREEIEQLKTEMVGLRQNFDRILRVRHTRM